ncbi:MAG: C10 family peptidase, partial [Anaerolineae bacterium]|nr:C10 family peptidase [Anaerolineae bacterium]
MKKHLAVFYVFLCTLGLLLGTSYSFAQATAGPEPDPPDDRRHLVGVNQSLAVTDINPRYSHLTFNFLFRNDGPSTVTHLDVYLPIPTSHNNQRMTDLSFSHPYTPLVDRYGQAVAHMEFDNLAAGQQATVSWGADVWIEPMSFNIDPAQVQDMSHIPTDVIELYTTAESYYRLDSQIIQDAAQIAANGAITPYLIARNVHDFVAARLTYVNDHQWDDAETVYLQQHGSCSEYTILFIALCRANGLPARYVGGSHQRALDVYTDTVFHRWAEVYLPPYGWVPIDVTYDDVDAPLPRYDYFGALDNRHFVTTIGGGDSEYLGWNYHDNYNYTYDGTAPSCTRERSFLWISYPSELVVTPTVISQHIYADEVNPVIGEVSLMSTNGDYSWSLAATSDWLNPSGDYGTTPSTLEIVAETDQLTVGDYTGTLQFDAPALAKSITVPVHLQMLPPRPYLLETQWGQRDEFTRFSPDHLRLGCWSTAIAQIVYYHRLLPLGSVSYTTSTGYAIHEDFDAYSFNWDRFVNKIAADTSETSIDEVARYAYFTAVVIQKDFDTGDYLLGHAERAEAVATHYDAEAHLYSSSSHSMEQLEQIIQQEIDAHRPVLLHLRTLAYSGDVGYHAVVADGYYMDDGQLWVHINMGVEGYTDGWYNFAEPIQGYDDKSYLKVMTIQLDYFAVSGQVLDTYGNPLPDVLLASEPYSTATGENGLYALTHLPTGTYTLTPMLAGYTFSPTLRTVSVPPQAH